MGSTLVTIAAAILLNLASLPELAEQISRDPGVIFLSGILLVVAGLAITRAHNVWAGGWPVLVTVFGWLAILNGLTRMFFPMQLATLAAAMAQRPAAIITDAIVILVLGGFLSFKAYSRD
jgi:F0F1-type ATP synthase membrane subunit a